MNCKCNNSCCSPTQQWKEMLLNTQDKAIQAYNLAQQALDEIENLPAGGGGVQSVNGELPDQDGDVTVDTGVMTVNGVSADADGDFTVSGGQNVTVTETVNGIEISAEGGSLSAEAPLEIVNDTIKLKGWTLYNSTDWSGFVSNGIVTEDIYIVSNSDIAIGETFVPKGTPLIANTPRLDTIGYELFATPPRLRVATASLSTILRNNSQITCDGLRLNISGSSSDSGINQNITIGSIQVSANVDKKITMDNTKGVRLFTRS